MWQIYYDGGKIHNEQDGPPIGENARGVQAILQDHPEVGWHIQNGQDYYVCRCGRWMGVDLFGLFDYLLDTGLVVFGRTVASDAYKGILERALADRTLARKTGWLRQELADGST